MGKYVRKLSYTSRLLLAALFVLTILVLGLFIQRNATTIYSGTLPCADCIGIKTILTLHGDKTYTLQSIYINKGSPFTEKGTWQQMRKNNINVLALKSKTMVNYYQIIDWNWRTLRMLDTSAQPIDSPFNMTLTRQ